MSEIRSPQKSLFGYGWKSRAIVFVVTGLSTCVAIALGILFSEILSVRRAVLIIICIIISFPITQYILYVFLVKNRKK